MPNFPDPRSVDAPLPIADPRHRRQSTAHERRGSRVADLYARTIGSRKLLERLDLADRWIRPTGHHLLVKGPPTRRVGPAPGAEARPRTPQQLARVRDGFARARSGDAGLPSNTNGLAVNDFWSLKWHDLAQDLHRDGGVGDLNIRVGDLVCDVGGGHGFYERRLAARVAANAPDELGEALKRARGDLKGLVGLDSLAHYDRWREQSGRVILTDLDKDALNKARTDFEVAKGRGALWPHLVDIREGREDGLPLEAGERLDYCWLANVSQYFLDPAPFLSMLLRDVRDGGILGVKDMDWGTLRFYLWSDTEQKWEMAEPELQEEVFRVHYARERDPSGGRQPESTYHGRHLGEDLERIGCVDVREMPIIVNSLYPLNIGQPEYLYNMVWHISSYLDSPLKERWLWMFDPDGLDTLNNPRLLVTETEFVFEGRKPPLILLPASGTLRRGTGRRPQRAA